jgi:hypothetical protein
MAIASKQSTSKLTVKYTYTIFRNVHLALIEFVHRVDAAVGLVSAGEQSASFIPTRH